jgi:hypothetical protein
LETSRFIQSEVAQVHGSWRKFPQHPLQKDGNVGAADQKLDTQRTPIAIAFIASQIVLKWRTGRSECEHSLVERQKHYLGMFVSGGLKFRRVTSKRNLII